MTGETYTVMTVVLSKEGTQVVAAWKTSRATGATCQEALSKIGALIDGARNALKQDAKEFDGTW